MAAVGAAAKADAKQKVEGRDAVKHVAESLRMHGPETRSSILGEQRVDVFRSKDFFRHLLKEGGTDRAALDEAIAPRETMDIPGGKDAKTVLLEDQIKRLGVKLVQQNYIRRVDRFVKVRSKGRKHVKFPKRVEIHTDNTFVEDGFYMWRFDRPRTIWNTLGSFGLVLMVMAGCFFPLAPYKIKLGVLYTSLSLLSLIFGAAFFRAVVFTIAWIVIGRYFWILPNLFNEEIPIRDVFKPLHSVTSPPDGTRIRLVNRLIAALVFASTVIFLYQISPDSEGLAKTAKSANQGILEMLNLQNPQAQLAGRSGNETLSPAEAAPKRRMRTATDIAAEAAAAGVAAAAAAEAALKGGVKEKREVVHINPFAEDFLDEDSAAAAAAAVAAAKEAAVNGTGEGIEGAQDGAAAAAGGKGPGAAAGADGAAGAAADDGAAAKAGAEEGAKREAATAGAGAASAGGSPGSDGEL